MEQDIQTNNYTNELTLLWFGLAVLSCVSLYDPGGGVKELTKLPEPVITCQLSEEQEEMFILFITKFQSEYIIHIELHIHMQQA